MPFVGLLPCYLLQSMSPQAATHTTAPALPLASERASVWVGASMAGAWLVPNHYPPWAAAWSETWCIATLLFLAGLHATRLRLPMPALWAVAVGLVGITLQLALGRQLFMGDAVISAAYLLLFLVAVAVGAAGGGQVKRPSIWLGGLMIGWIIAASLSVFIAAVQWTQALALGIFAADLPPSAQPFGNIGQANHLATLTCLGLCALLWCHERRWIGPLCLAVAGAWLMFGMALTQSRTAGLNLIVLALVLAVASRRIRLRISWPAGALGGLAFGAAVWAIPRLSEGLLLPAGRPIDAQLSPGQRPAVWSGMLEALWQQPWLGYGWQQAILAQEHFALDRPPLRHAFEHSHNQVLDLLLWNGVPIGLTLVVILTVWLWRLLKAAADGPDVCLCAALLVLCAHSMVEYPLAYAYFLVPAGLLLGSIGRHGDRTLHALHLPRLPAVAFIGLVTALALLIGWDYARIEQAYRLARFQAAGLNPAASPAVTLRPWVLTQLSAPLDVATLVPVAGMPGDEIRRLRDAHRRYPTVVTGYRYALAAGLNGQLDEAELILRRTCAMHAGLPCLRLGSAWRWAQQAHPELLAVPAPVEQKGPTRPR